MPEVNVVLANNILNEVIHGFRVPNFEEVLGVSRAHASCLLSQVHARVRNRDEMFAMSSMDTTFFCKALKRTLEELGEGEFQTRTGFYLEEANAVLKQLCSKASE